MFDVVLLICTLTTAPQDCSPDTAVAVLHAPHAGDPTSCGLRGQTFMASASYVKHSGDYLKIVCRRMGKTASL